MCASVNVTVKVKCVWVVPVFVNSSVCTRAYNFCIVHFERVQMVLSVKVYMHNSGGCLTVANKLTLYNITKLSVLDV